MFIGGCGKFFEGTAADMLKNFDLIESFPDLTYLFCGHGNNFFFIKNY